MKPFARVVVGENTVSLLKDGAQTFPAMLEAIAQATSTVCFETYIFRADKTGLRFGEALKERARAGVEVNLMFDDWGSTLPPAFLEDLKQAGVRTVAYRPVQLLRGKWAMVVTTLGQRNHRKALIVDGRIGFTGGLNISDDYASVEDGGQGWRDTHLRIEGPAASALQQYFERTWKRHKGALLDPARHRSQSPDQGAVRIIANDFSSHKKEIRSAYLKAIGAARVSISLTNAYFLPPARLIKALSRAARRGVKVSVILGSRTDVRMVLWAARGLYPRLLKAGVRVFEWEGPPSTSRTGPILHAKTAVVDGAWSTVGSANLDALSLRRNLEINAIIENAEFGAAQEALFRADLVYCQEISLQFAQWRGLAERLVYWLAYQFRSWL